MRNASAASLKTTLPGADPNSAKDFPSHLSPNYWNRANLSAWLQTKDDLQQRLFAATRHARQAAFGDRVIVRGLMEVTNLCRVNCEFCPMRRDNTRRNTIFELSEEQILETAGQIKASGINIVFLQAGEIKKTTQIVGNVLPKIRAMFGGALELLLCLGNKSEEEYIYLRKQGATSYILKHETSVRRSTRSCVIIHLPNESRVCGRWSAQATRWVPGPSRACLDRRSRVLPMIYCSHARLEHTW